MMSRTHWMILFSLILLIGCSESADKYHIERKQWQGGEILEYHEYQDAERTFVSAQIVKQQLICLDETFEFPGVLINAACLDRGEVFVVVDNNFGRFLTRLDIDGGLEYILEMSQLRYSVITGITITRLPANREVLFSFSYLSDEGEAKWGHTAQVDSFVDVDPYRF